MIWLRISLLLLASLLPLTSVLAGDDPQIGGRTLGDWLKRLAPSPAESVWEQIPWLSSYHKGLKAAGDQSRPVLLWLMNGHPLGCT